MNLLRSVLIIVCLAPMTLFGTPTANQLSQFQQAEKLYQSGKYAETLELWDQLMATQLAAEEQQIVQFNRARTLIEMRRVEEAIPILNALTADSTAPSTLIRAATVQAGIASIQLADTLCQQPIDLNTDPFPLACEQAIAWLQRSEKQMDLATIQLRELADGEDLRLLEEGTRIRLRALEDQKRAHRLRHAPYADLAEELAGEYRNQRAQVTDDKPLKSLLVEQKNVEDYWKAIQSRGSSDPMARAIVADGSEGDSLVTKAAELSDRQRAAWQLARVNLALRTLAEQARGSDPLHFLLSEIEQAAASGADATLYNSLFSRLEGLSPEENLLTRRILRWISDNLADLGNARSHRMLYEIADHPETESLLQLLQQRDGDLVLALAQKFSLRNELENNERAVTARTYLLEGKISQALLVWDPAAFVTTELQRLIAQQETLLAKKTLDLQDLSAQMESQRELREIVERLPQEETALRDLSTPLTKAEGQNAEAAARLMQHSESPVELYLRDARQWLRRALHTTKGKELPPAPVLEWALDEQNYALQLNRYAQTATDTPNINDLLKSAQQFAVDAAEPFRPAFQKLGADALSDPWKEVLPLFDRGLGKAQVAITSLPSLKLAEQAQDEARDLWKKALDKLRSSEDKNNQDQNQDQKQPPKDDSIPSDQQQPEQQQESPSKEQEILDLLQQMEAEDRQHPAPKGPVRKGVRPW